MAVAWYFAEGIMIVWKVVFLAIFGILLFPCFSLFAIRKIFWRRVVALIETGRR